MGTQVNNLREKQALQAVKAYVDNQATAQVIRTETVLFDGEASVSSANNLNQSLANFDAVRIVASAKNTTDGSLWAMIEQEFGIDELTDSSPKMSATEYNNTSGTGATTAGGYTLTLLFTDTTFSITRTGNSNWITHNPTIRKIYGINYVPMENYSTTEQVVGTWIDGKPLYQKVCVYDVAGQCAINTWTDIPVPNLPTNIETHADVTVSNGNNTIPMAAGVYNGKLRYYTDAAYGWTKLYITIKYTKASS